MGVSVAWMTGLRLMNEIMDPELREQVLSQRPAWLTDKDEVDYGTTERNEPFRGTEVSRKSVADLIVKIIESHQRSRRRNLGVNKPNTTGDKPAFL
jgi:hypothetical protein